ncbi:hypothetical protein GGI05_005896, partial [Coemansia sp. RSA 2603]
GTRLLAAVAKRVYLGRSPHAESHRMIAEAAYDLATPLVRLVLVDGQRHPMLRQECLVALTVLAATSAVDQPHVAAIVRLLAPEHSLPLCVVAAPPDQEEDQDEDQPQQPPSEPCSFGDALVAVMRADADVWPQTTLQAKSLVTGLRDQLADLLANPTSSDAQRLDADGLRILRDDLIPLL